MSSHFLDTSLKSSQNLSQTRYPENRSEEFTVDGSETKGFNKNVSFNLSKYTKHQMDNWKLLYFYSPVKSNVGLLCAYACCKQNIYKFLIFK